jgi:hypothetical protein
LRQLLAEAPVKQNAIIGHRAGGHVQQPGHVICCRHANGDGVGAVETHGAIMQAHETVRIAEGEADITLSRGFQRIGAGRAEM